MYVTELGICGMDVVASQEYYKIGHWLAVKPGFESLSRQTTDFSIHNLNQTAKCMYILFFFKMNNF